MERAGKWAHSTGHRVGTCPILKRLYVSAASFGSVGQVEDPGNSVRFTPFPCNFMGCIKAENFCSAGEEGAICHFLHKLALGGEEGKSAAGFYRRCSVCCCTSLFCGRVIRTGLAGCLGPSRPVRREEVSQAPGKLEADREGEKKSAWCTGPSGPDEEGKGDC